MGQLGQLYLSLSLKRFLKDDGVIVAQLNLIQAGRWKGSAAGFGCVGWLTCQGAFPSPKGEGVGKAYSRCGGHHFLPKASLFPPQSLRQHVVQRLQRLHDDLDIGEDGHEIGIAVPARHEVPVQMARQASAGGAAEV